MQKKMMTRDTATPQSRAAARTKSVFHLLDSNSRSESAALSIEIMIREKHTVLGPPGTLAALDNTVKSNIKRPPGRKVDASCWRDETHASKNHRPGDVVEELPFAT